MRGSKPWTPDEIARLISMAEAGASWDAIGEALSRGPFGCQAKWRELRSPEERARTRVAKLDQMRKGSTMAAPRAVRRDIRDSEIIVARQAPARPTGPAAAIADRRRARRSLARAQCAGSASHADIRRKRKWLN